MQCKSCNTELPKSAKVCPKCGEIIDDKHSGNLKVIAVIGLVIALVGGLLPFVQNTDEITDAYSFMSIDMPVLWYIQIVVTCCQTRYVVYYSNCNFSYYLYCSICCYGF